jgi:two-component system, NtrC family, response regulator
MVEEGRFRQDLFFRLCSLSIELPPLRDRMEDVRDLATFHMSQLCQRYGKGTKGFSPQFLEALEAYQWPGNVRELMGCLESALAVARDEPTLFPDHLPIHIRVQLAKASVSRSTPREELGYGPFDPARGIPSLSQFRDSAIAAAEKEYLQALMAQPGMSIQEACRVAGLSRPRLYALLKIHGIKRTA